LLTNKLTKILAFNIIIAVINIVVFSPGIIGLRIGGPDILSTAFGLTVIIMSIIIFFLGNFNILKSKEETSALSDISTTEDYITALRKNKFKGPFNEIIDIIIGQIERLPKKKAAITDILNEKYSKVEISYQRFQSSLSDVEYIFFNNVKSIINRINTFDENDYKELSDRNYSKQFSQPFIQSKLQIYNEYIAFVNKATEDNEKILLKLDKLLFELSRLDYIDEGQIENLPEIKEIDALIKQAEN
jgi:hypothetical protein